MNTLSDKTTIPIKSALPVMVTVIAATLWITNMLNGVITEQKVASIDREKAHNSISDLKVALQEVRMSVTTDRWTSRDMTVWVARLRELNEGSGLRVPPVEE